MDAASLTFLGSGDAFGSGGRLQTCMLVRAGGPPFLIDCGTSALAAMQRQGVDPNELGLVLLSHLHGDHFGGLPFLVLHGQFNRRSGPLRVAGPPGTRQRLAEAMEVLFPGSSRVERRFAVEVTELEPGRPQAFDSLTVTPQEVVHPCGAPPLALRVECAGRVLAYTGDTEWCEGLLSVGRGATLLVAEAYTYERPIRFHLSWAALREHLAGLAPERLALTHMGPDMLGRLDDLRAEAGSHPDLALHLAEDGLSIGF